MKKKTFLKIIGILIALFLVSFGSWMSIEFTVELTSDAFFCGKCHPMEPMIDSYMASTHGGNNSHGVMAACTDCHVSHESLVSHILGKAKSGSHDVWVMYTQDTSQIDWETKRLRREEFVYDSGCLTCHQNLENATQGNTKAFIAHKAYFLGETEDQCVSCHQHVGHKNLGHYINQ